MCKGSGTGLVGWIASDARSDIARKVTRLKELSERAGCGTARGRRQGPGLRPVRWRSNHMCMLRGSGSSRGPVEGSPPEVQAGHAVEGCRALHQISQRRNR